MTLVTRFICGLFVVAVLTTGCAEQGYGQRKNDNILDRQVSGVTINESSIAIALSRIAAEFQIPIGLEVAAKEANLDDKPISVFFEKATLREILNAIVKLDSRYCWQVAGRAINVNPCGRGDSLLKGLLDTKIEEFSSGANPTVYRLRYDILKIPEVNSVIERAGVTPFVVALSGADYESTGQGFSMNASDIILRDLLNQIVSRSDLKFWILTRYGKNNELLILNF